MKTALRFSTLLALGLFGLGVAAHAQVFTYWGGTGADATAFNAADNWDNGAPDNSGSFAQVAAINTGTVNLAGAATADVVFVGNGGGTATLNLGSGSSLTAHYLSFGVEEGSSGTGTIANGASVTLDSGLIVGDDALFGPALTTGTSGNLTISSGGSVNGSITVGSAPLSTGTVTVTGSGSIVTGGISGAGGTAHITVSNSASVQNGVYGGSGSTDITVNSGANIDGGIGAGGNGAGTSSFTVSGGATLTNGSISVDAGSGGSATGTITGGNHTTVGSIGLGGGGTNQLTVQGGATLDGSANTNTSSIGYSGSANTLTLTDGGTVWTDGGDLFIGRSGGTGTFNVSSGAVTSHANVTIGRDTGSVGTLNVTGASTFASSGVLRLGDNTGSGGGTGTMTVSGGSAVTSDTAYVGNGAGGTGSVTIGGAESSWTVANGFEVGSAGTGTVTVSNGGTLINGSTATIGSGSTSNGSVLITGTNSTWTSANTVTVSAAGSGSIGAITLADGGQLTITNGLLRLSEGTGAGTLNIGAAANAAAAAPGTLNLLAGSVRSLGSNGTVVFNHTSNNYVFDDSLEFGVKVLQQAGTTTLAGPVTAFVYSGGTTISGGTLQLGADGAIGTGPLTLAGGTLDLNNFTQTAGPLTLAGNSYIDFNGISALTVADSSATGWSGSLTLLNFDGSDSFRVGTSSGGLTGTQLSLIDVNGFIAAIDASGFITASSTPFSAVPEPSAYAALAGLAALGLAAYRRRFGAPEPGEGGSRLEVQAEQQL